MSVQSIGPENNRGGGNKALALGLGALVTLEVAGGVVIGVINTHDFDARAQQAAALQKVLTPQTGFSGTVTEVSPIFEGIAYADLNVDALCTLPGVATAFEDANGSMKIAGFDVDVSIDRHEVDLKFSDPASLHSALGNLSCQQLSAALTTHNELAGIPN